MASRDDLLPLKASRRGYKGLTTKYRRTALDAIKAFVEGDDPFYVESKLESWEKKLDQFRNAEDLVVCHPAADENDMDKDLDDHEDAFDRAKLKVRGFRQDFDRAREAISSGVSDISPNNSPNPGLPKLNIKRPPVLEEDTDLRSFIQWCHLWNNYANLLALSKRDRTTQVSLFWECCSPGFFQIIQHSLGIKPDTGREVDEIIRMVRDHLRSLRSVHLDMRDLLLVRQQDGQDYTSLCNVLREQADFADLANITQDKLLIALLLQAMKCEDDKMKVMERNPQTFDEARHQILELETSRHGAKGMSPAHHVFAARSKSQYRSQKDFKFVKKSSDASCKYCGRFAHPREKCPAQKSQCRTCNQKGHWDKVCRSRSLDTKVRQETKQFSSSRVGSLKLHRASSHTLSTVSNEIEIGITPVGYGGYPIRITFCADTGADISVMGVDLFTKSGLSKIVTLSDSLIEDVIGIDGTSIKQMGMFSATLSIVDISAEEIPIVVCHGLRDAYLSLDACKALTIIDGNFPSPKPKVASLLLPNPSHSKSLFWKDRESWISQLPNEAGPDIFKMIESKLREIYSKVFECDTLSPMTGPIVGEPMVIHLKDDARPFAIHVARQIPFANGKILEKILSNLVKQSVIVPVGDVATEWCHPIVLVPKDNGELRLCVDLTRLNSEVKRSIHPTKTPAEAISGFSPQDSFFAKLDLVKGYWQMPLAKESQPLTTFLTPFGKFMFLRSPMGFVSTGDSFSFRGDVAMAGLKVHKVVDDMACGEETLPKLVRTVSDVLERCLTFGLTVNSKKSILASSSINFVGYHIKKGTIEVDSSKVDAIQNFPIPATLTDLRSFLGLVNQLGKFLPNLASYTSPFRPLLKSKNAFLWLPEHTKIFEETKRALVSPPVLDMYDPSLETILLTDASRLGLGFALTQLKDGVPKLIQCGSRFLKDCESRYAMVELETLAIYWAVKKCNLYLAGINFHVVTDHKPLVSIFNRQILSEIENPRVLNYRTRLMGYNFVVAWKQGINHAIPDALSRAPVSKPDADSDSDPLGDPRPLTIASLRSEYPDLILDDIIEFAKTDEAYSTLKAAILADTVECAKSGYVSLFKKVASELSVDEDVVLRNKQIVIPPSAVKEILKRLHTSHQGVEKTKRRARQIVYWPGFTSDIANTVAACPQCMFFRPSHQAEPLIQDSPPTRPFQVVSADLFTYGQCEYLVYSDRLSGYPLVIQYRTSPNSSLLMKDFARMFSLFGVPNVLRTDNGPQFASQSFSLFLKKWGVTWMSSSPYYPQSNGHAEVMVKSIKHLLAKTGGDFHSEDFAEGMLEFRNTPMADGLSPAQRVFGRPVRSRIPIHDELLQGDSTHDANRDVKRQSLAQTRKHYYDQSAKPLSPLSNGSVVFVQNPTTRRWDREAKIIKCYKRRYLLEFNNGHKSWRNRRFLRASFVDLPIESEILSACDGDAEPRLRRSTRSHRPPNRLGYHR